MNQPIHNLSRLVGQALPVLFDDLPVLFEDKGQDDMGDSWPHLTAFDILYNGLSDHLAASPTHQVLGDMCLYYHRRHLHSNVSPDVMVVTPPARLPRDLSSYRIGRHGPVPVLTVEVLSPRSTQQLDLTTKRRLYYRLGVTTITSGETVDCKLRRW